MKALILTRGGLTLSELPDPVVKSGDVLVETIYVGVCGTDLQMINGTRHCETRVLGHEGVARILVGTIGYAEGSLVTFSPVSRVDQDLILGHSTSGLLQKRRAVTAEEIEGGMLVPLPDKLPRPAFALAEPLAAAIYAWHLIVPYLVHRRLLVIGDGPVGQLATLYALERGADVTLAHGPNGRRMSRSHFDDLVVVCGSQLEAATESGQFDAVVLAVPRMGAASALKNAIFHVRNGGCIDLVGGMPQDKFASIDLELLGRVRRENVCGEPAAGVYVKMNVFAKTVWFCGHRGVSGEHMRLALVALERDDGRYCSLITHTVPWAPRLANQLMALSRGERLFADKLCIKMLVDMHGSDD